MTGNIVVGAVVGVAEGELVAGATVGARVVGLLVAGFAELKTGDFDGADVPGWLVA